MPKRKDQSKPNASEARSGLSVAIKDSAKLFLSECHTQGYMIEFFSAKPPPVNSPQEPTTVDPLFSFVKNALAKLDFYSTDKACVLRQMDDDTDDVLVFAYGRDLAISSRKSIKIDNVREVLETRTEVSRRGLFSREFLDIEVNRFGTKLCLSVGKQLKELLQTMGMTNCKPTAMPTEYHWLLRRDQKSPPLGENAASSYEKAVSRLRNAAEWARPDLSVAVNALERTKGKPTEEDMARLQHTLRYISGTLEYGLVYHMCELDAPQIEGHVDAEWAGDEDTRRSVTGYMFTHRNNPITWDSFRQDCVADTFMVAHAKALAASAHVAERLWEHHRMLQDRAPFVRVYNSCKAGIIFSQGPSLYEKTRHIDPREFDVAVECYVEGRVRTTTVPLGEQLANGLVRALPRPRFVEYREKMGVLPLAQTRKKN